MFVCINVHIYSHVCTNTYNYIVHSYNICVKFKKSRYHAMKWLKLKEKQKLTQYSSRLLDMISYWSNIQESLFITWNSHTSNNMIHAIGISFPNLRTSTLQGKLNLELWFDSTLFWCLSFSISLMEPYLIANFLTNQILFSLII